MTIKKQVDNNIFYDDGKELNNYKFIPENNSPYPPDFVEPSKKSECVGDIANCVHEDDGEPYICFNCEAEQVREKYPKAKYTDDLEWVIPNELN